MPISRFVKNNKHAEATQSLFFDGITTASTAHIITNVPRGSAIKAYPTAAGTATVYSTQRYIAKKNDPDNTQAEIAASTNRNWDAWGGGAVTAETIQKAYVPLEGVSIVVTSGTWTLEITVGE